MNKQKCLILTNGECVPVTGEDGKYFYADGRKFRRMSQQIVSVEEVEIPDDEASEQEAPARKKPAQPKAKRKKTTEEEPKEGE